MNNINYIQYFRRHTTAIKYTLIVLVFLSSLVTIRTYINYLTIQETIQNTNTEIDTQNQQINFTENFLLSYYHSNYKEFFFRHKNKILNPGERIIQIQIIDPEQEKEDKKNMLNEGTGTKISSPMKSWNTFIRDKWGKL